jgi:hypothetical protein
MSNKGKIESPLGRVSFNRSSGGRVLTVEDTDSNEYEAYSEPVEDPRLKNMEERLKHVDELRKIQSEQRQHAPAPAKNRLEILLGISRVAEDITVDNVTFSIRSLKNREMKEVIQAVMGETNAALQAYEIRANTIARSLYAIDGQDISYFPEFRSFENVLAYVQDMDDSLLNYLYNRYLNMVNENNKKFEDLGTTEEGIIDNVKKS